MGKSFKVVPIHKGEFSFFSFFLVITVKQLNNTFLLQHGDWCSWRIILPGQSPCACVCQHVTDLNAKGNSRLRRGGSECFKQ